MILRIYKLRRRGGLHPHRRSPHAADHFRRVRGIRGHQGKPEALRRAKAMLSKMDELGFGNCTNTRACEAECPKNVSISNIARLNRDFIIAKLKD